MHKKRPLQSVQRGQSLNKGQALHRVKPKVCPKKHVIEGDQNKCITEYKNLSTPIIDEKRIIYPMSKILELREKRFKAWEAAKAFLDAKQTPEGLLSAEDAIAYDRMEADVVALGK